MSLAPGQVSNEEHRQDIQVTSFFSLPRELRDMIYGLILGEGETYRQSGVCYAPVACMSKGSWPTCGRFNIAQICRAVNEEANEIIYRNNKFRFHLGSGACLNPRIIQKTADIMQNIHIILGSDEASMTRSVHVLQMFTFSQVVRKECRISIRWYDLKDFESMPPLLQILKGFTAFKVLVVGLTPYYWAAGVHKVHNQAVSLWKPMKEDLEAALGKDVSCSRSWLRSEFRPREHLVQRDHST